MSIQSWIVYVTLVVVATSSPGPSTVLIVTNSILYGWRKTTYTALGNVAALFLLGLLSVIGLGTLLKTSVLAFTVFKLVGVLYLFSLGVIFILKKHASIQVPSDSSAVLEISGWRLFLQALGVVSSSPKAILVLTTLFSQFLDPESALIPQFSGLIITLMLSSFIFLMCYAVLADGMKRWLSNPDSRMLVSRISGIIFISFSVMLAVSSQ
ncbi:MAG: LysE family translocator [FCB group bacterium]|nr:LysE family translocator [FCB group bacterium]MBL7120386.1 LysE family translocator [Candidatus Neomarinimicrobiota bacterium]